MIPAARNARIVILVPIYRQYRCISAKQATHHPHFPMAQAAHCQMGRRANHNFTCPPRIAEGLPAAIGLLKGIVAEMETAGDHDRLVEPADPAAWAAALRWVLEHIEDDARELAKAAAAVLKK